MKLALLTLLITINTLSIFSQKEIKEDNSIKGQFDKIYRTSTTYQVYKVISKKNMKR